MINSMQVIGKLKPWLINEAVEMRAKGESFDDIARFVSNESDLIVGRESVRRWFIAREKSHQAAIVAE